MTRRPWTVSFVASALVVSALFVPSTALAADAYPTLEGTAAARAVFDVRTPNVATAATLLDLIHETHRDRALAAPGGATPTFAVVFIGPSVKWLSTTAASPGEESEARARVHRRLTEMAEDGISLEACLFAARLMGVEPSSIHPAVKQVDNGFVSSIVYQSNGYALVPVF